MSPSRSTWPSTPRRWRPVSWTASRCGFRKATSTAAGSPTTSWAPSRAARERWIGREEAQMQAQGIDDVLQILDGIIAGCKAKSDPLGYFPALYRQVTLTVKKGIDTGYFDDGPRMDGFDALFADRYFAAYDAFRSGGQPPQSWQVAFDSTH